MSSRHGLLGSGSLDGFGGPVPHPAHPAVAPAHLQHATKFAPVDNCKAWDVGTHHGHVRTRVSLPDDEASNRRNRHVFADPAAHEALEHVARRDQTTARHTHKAGTPSLAEIVNGHARGKAQAEGSVDDPNHDHLLGPG